MYTGESMLRATSSDRVILIFLGAVMLINAISYGIILPLLYPFVSTFGISPTGLSLLFATFSFFQLIATPIIGRLSDRYGRRPLLLLSLLGTAGSMVLFATAGSVWQLFLARMMDGITGGNMSVAQSVVADRFSGEKRAPAFGMLGAASGVGFMIGPAIGGFLSGISLAAPFWAAAVLALVGTVFGFFFLPETWGTDQQRVVRQQPFFSGKVSAVLVDLFSVRQLWSEIRRPISGLLFLTILFISLGQFNFVIGFQSFTVDVLLLTPKQVGILYLIFGLVAAIVQSWGIKYTLPRISNHELLVHILLGIVMLSSVLMLFAHSLFWFGLTIMLYTIGHAPMLVIITGMISNRTPRERQGEVLGVAAAMTSLGQIFGPLIAGVIAAATIRGIFGASVLLFAIAAIIWSRVSSRVELATTAPSK
jgi:MFS family permease